MNAFSYQVGIYRDFGSKEALYYFVPKNDSGGEPSDIDQYGFPIYPGYDTLFPGDVDLSGEFFDMDLDYSEEKEHKLLG